MTAGRRVFALALLGPGLAALGLAPGALADAAGDPARGRAVFEAKGCARCHRPSDAGPGVGPALEVVRRPQGMLELAGRLWNHAPAMLAALGQAGLAWPELAPADMVDLAAYLQGDAARDPQPDLLQGRAVLVRKGCLKCHRLAGEGGAVASEFSREPARFQSTVGWAASVWNHAPRMAAQAARLGILYPRFTGEEMTNLVGFLRQATAAR